MNLENLIQEAKNGSEQSKKALYMHLYGECFNICRRYVRNIEDAEERMLDGFYKMFTTIKHFEYKNDLGFYGWLNKIMINECLMQLRNKPLFVTSLEDEAYNISEQNYIIEKLETEEILNLIAQLPYGY